MLNSILEDTERSLTQGQTYATLHVLPPTPTGISQSASFASSESMPKTFFLALWASLRNGFCAPHFVYGSLTNAKTLLTLLNDFFPSTLPFISDGNHRRQESDERCRRRTTTVRVAASAHNVAFLPRSRPGSSGDPLFPRR